MSTKRSALAQVQAAFAAGDATQASVDKARKEYWSKLVDWSSTTAGAASLREQLAKEPDQTSGQAQGLRRAIDQGALLAQRNREVENEYRAARGKGPLDTPVPLTFGQEAEAATEQAERSAREAAAAADPLGLRAAEVVAPQVTLPPKPAEGAPVRPVMPTHRPIPAPTAIPTAIPTAMPTRAAQSAEAFEALREQGAAAAAARVESDRAAAEAQRSQAEAELRARGVALPVSRPALPSAAATVQMPVVPAAPVMPMAPAAVAMPVQMPAPAMAPAMAPAPSAAQAAAAQRREQAQEQRAAQKAAQKAAADARNAEVNRLRREVTDRNKKAVDFARNGAVNSFTAPEHVWDGPSRFRGEAPATVKENWAAMRAGTQAFGENFETLVARHAGQYTPAEVLDACTTLHRKGLQVASGGNPPSEQWYASYQHLDRNVLNQALQSIQSEIGHNERALLAQRYVFANAEGVLNRTLKQQPRARRHLPSTVTARAYERWRRMETRVARFLPRSMAGSQGPAFT